MKQLVAQQRTFWINNSTQEIDFRIQQLKKLKALLKTNESLLNQAIYDDFQRSAFDNYTNELGLLYREIDHTIKNIKTWAKRKRAKTNWINFPARSYIIPEPLGVVLVIGAWNYPFLLSLAPVVAALAAGNTVILKPSELPAHTSAVLTRLINENFEPHYFVAVEGGISETSELLLEKFDKIFFTGSVAVGKIVYQAAAKHLTPVTLELGGKSPSIITEDCNLPMCVKRLVWAKFLNAGQTCIAPDYVVIHESRKAEFLGLVKAEIEKECYSVSQGNYIQIINDKNLTKLTKLIEKDKLYYGGSYDETARILEPTIMHNISFEDAVMQEEIFGPILPVISYTNLDEVIGQIKAMPKPLACYIFTKQKSLRDKILKEVSFGGGAVNDAIMHFSNGHMPFGGVGDSGIGSYHGESGFKTFSHYKSILDKPTWFEPNLKYFPHTPFKFKLIKFLMNL